MESDDRREDEPGDAAGDPGAALPVGGASRARVEVGTLEDGRTVRYFSSAPATSEAAR